MAAVRPFSHLFDIQSKGLTREEFYLLEAELYTKVFNQIKILIKEKYDSYFKLLFDVEKEKAMLETKSICLIVRDLIASGNYNLQGLAKYTDTPEEVIEEVLSEKNNTPSAVFLHRVLELHQEVRTELYMHIRNKIRKDYLE